MCMCEHKIIYIHGTYVLLNKGHFKGKVYTDFLSKECYKIETDIYIYIYTLHTQFLNMTHPGYRCQE